MQLIMYLSSEFNDNVQLPIHSRKSLIRHVSCGPSSANKNIVADGLEANVLDVWMKPTVRLPIHRLRTQSCGNKIHSLIFQQPTRLQQFTEINSS